MRYYQSRHVANILGVTKDQLHNWVNILHLVTPERMGRGRSSRNKFSFKDLLDLALIKELYELGFEPGMIKHWLDPYKGSGMPEEWKGSIWNAYKDGREEEDFDEEKREWEEIGYDKIGFLLLFVKTEEGYKIAKHGPNFQVLEFLRDEFEEGKKSSKYKTYLIVDIRQIVNEVEEKTGEKL